MLLFYDALHMKMLLFHFAFNDKKDSMQGSMLS